MRPEWTPRAAAAVIIVIVALILTAIHALAQYDPAPIVRSLVLLPDRNAWVLTQALPGNYRFCGSQDVDGTLRGCVSAADLRARAAAERAPAKKGQP